MISEAAFSSDIIVALAARPLQPGTRIANLTEVA